MGVARILRAKKDTVCAVKPDEKLQAVIDTMASLDARAVIVLNAEHRIEGLISERDVVRALASNAADALGRRASEIMGRGVPTCNYNMREAELMKMMVESHASALPVVAGQVPIGMVTMHDVMKLRMEKIAQLLQEIERESHLLCAPHEAVQLEQ